MSLLLREQRAQDDRRLLRHRSFRIQGDLVAPLGLGLALSLVHYDHHQHVARGQADDSLWADGCSQHNVSRKLDFDEAILSRLM